MNTPTESYEPPGGTDPLFEGLTKDAQIAQAQDEYLRAVNAELWMRDFWRFQYECLGNNEETSPKFEFMHEPLYKATCDFITKLIHYWLSTRHAQTEFLKAMIVNPRETGKTVITTSLPVWVNVLDPDMACVVSGGVMEGLSGAESMLATISGHFLGERRNSKLIETFGSFYELGRPWNTRQIVTAKRVDLTRRDPTVAICSVDTGAVGSHPPLFIGDDWILQNKQTKAHYAACEQHIAQLFPIMPREGLFLYDGTRWPGWDPIGWFIENDIKPKTMAKYGGTLPEDFNKQWWKYAFEAGWFVFHSVGAKDWDCNQPNYPTVWPAERLENYRRLFPAHFAAQVQNSPTAREDNPLTEEHITRAMVDPVDVPPQVWTRVTIQMDLAWKNWKQFAAQSGDRNAIGVIGRNDRGVAYYLDGHVGRDMREGFEKHFIVLYERCLRENAQIWALTRDKDVGGETGIDDWFKEILGKRGYPIPLVMQMPRAGTIKGDRFMLFTRYVIEMRFRIVRGAQGSQELIDEILSPLSAPHDDVRDMASDTFDTRMFNPLTGLAFPAPEDVAFKFPSDRDRIAEMLPRWARRGVEGINSEDVVIAGQGRGRRYGLRGGAGRWGRG